MSSSFDAFGGHGEDLPEGMDVHSRRPFDSDGYAGYDPRLPSQRFETFEMSDRFPDEHFPLDEMKDPEDDFKVSHNGYDPFHGGGPPPYHSAFDEESIANSPDRSSSAFGQAFESSPQPDFGSRADDFSPDATSNGKGFGHDQAADGLFVFSPEAPAPFGNNNNGPILPPPDELQPEEGFILREWRRQNAIHLEEKERKERERLSQIIDAADAYKQEYYVKRKTHCETSKSNNREKEKVFLATHESFHTNADKHYWKAIAELVPHELPSAIDTRSRGKKDKKPTVIVNQGPKPGKATDLSRMRQILLKLKHNPPAHMKEKKVPPAPSAPANGTAPAPAPAPASAPAPAPAPASAPTPTPTPTPTPATSAPAVQEAAAPA